MHRVTFILPCALFTPLLDSLLSQYTVVHLLHVRRTLRPRTPQPLEREARGQPWGKSSSTTNGNKKNLHDQKHTSKKTFCCFLPYSLSVLSSPCHRYKFCVFARKRGYSLSRDHKHISHRAERALQNRSHCPQMFISLHLYTSLSFQPPLNFLVQETRVVGSLISSSQFHIQTLASIFGHISCLFFFFFKILFWSQVAERIVKGENSKSVSFSAVPRAGLGQNKPPLCQQQLLTVKHQASQHSAASQSQPSPFSLNR